MNKRIINAIRETRDYPTLPFELVVIDKSGNRHTHNQITAKQARYILRKSADVVQLITG